jgi:hypothetical protein
MNRNTVIAVAAVIVVLLPGCCSCPKSMQQFPRTEIHYSSGGGVSGMSSGYSILADGTVTRWTGQRGTRDSESTIGRLESEDHRALLADIHAVPLADLHQQDTGNMTTTLRIVRDDEVFLFSWPGLHMRDDDAPPSMRPLRDPVWDRIRSLGGERE